MTVTVARMQSMSENAESKNKDNLVLLEIFSFFTIGIVTADSRFPKMAARINEGKRPRPNSMLKMNTAVKQIKKEITLNLRPLGADFRNFFKSVFMPDSKRRKTSAKVVNIGAKLSKSDGETHLNTDPSIIPIRISHITSGIFVLSNILSPRKPIKRIAARVRNTVSIAISSI